MLPGDIAAATLGQGATPERLDALREELGLNRSLPEQYLEWAGHALVGDLGTSMRTNQAVSSEIRDRLGVTFELAILSTLVSVVIAVPLGIISAVKQDTIVDYVLRIVAIIGLSVPSFWLAILVIILPAIWWHWSAPVGYEPLLDDPWANLQQVGRPAVIMGVGMSAFIMRMMRSSLLEVLRQDYVRTARAKGLRGRAVVLRHGVKNSLIPVLTVLGLQFSLLLGGTVIMEQIFALPGLGRLTLDAILTRDYPLIQGTVLLFSVVFIVMNLLVDLAYGYLDPRVRFV
jgi:peptide/nickel transport system permease protein